MADMKKVLFLYRQSETSNQGKESVLEGEALVRGKGEENDVSSIHHNSNCIAS